MNMMVSILVIASLLFGGGATVNAAQDDLPNESLYGLKLWSEDLGLQIQKDPEQKVERLMELAQVRIQEMTQLANTSQAVPDQLQQRLQLHIQQALQICATQDEPAMDRMLLQIRDRLQQQDRDMEQLHAAQDVQPILQQTRTMLQQHLELVDEGLLNHEMFRYAVRNGFRLGREEEIVPPVQNGPGPLGGQPTDVPAGPNNNPGGPNTDPTGTGYGTGEPNPDPGQENTDLGGPNMSATPSSPTGSGGMDGNGTGGSGTGGNGSGGNGTGSSDTGGNGTGGNGTGGGGGGGGCGTGGQGGRP